jgi:hypothetical protein
LFVTVDLSWHFFLKMSEGVVEILENNILFTSLTETGFISPSVNVFIATPDVMISLEEENMLYRMRKGVPYTVNITC